MSKKPPKNPRKRPEESEDPPPGSLPVPKPGGPADAQPPNPPVPDDAPTAEPLFLDIYVGFKQIDPNVSPDGSASEQTRDAMNARCEVPAEREDAAPKQDTVEQQNDRTRRLESESLRETEESLAGIFREWVKKTEELAVEAAARTAAPPLVAARRIAEEMRRRKLDAEHKLGKAHRKAHDLWEKYAVSKEDVIKDIQKKVVWVAIVYLLLN